MKRKNSWVDNPTKKQAYTIFFIWLTGTILLMLSATNFLTESPFQRKYLGFSFLVLASTITMIPVCKKYFKGEKVR